MFVGDDDSAYIMVIQIHFRHAQKGLLTVESAIHHKDFFVAADESRIAFAAAAKVDDSDGIAVHGSSLQKILAIPMYGQYTKGAAIKADLFADAV
jgi:hypothetical protein